MARRNVVSKESLNLTAPNYAALSEAIDDFQNEERLFYVRRAEELSQYPGIGDKTKDQVESAYDSLLGERPWNYLDEFNSSNNPESQETNSDTDEDGNDADSFYVSLPEKLESRLDNSYQLDEYGNKYVLYNPGTGFAEVDLLYTNINYFQIGSTGYADDEDENAFSYRTGFGEVPVKYQSNSSMDGRVAHMKRLIGSLWNDQVKPYWNAYENELDKYNDYVGGGLDTDIITGSDPDRPWEGLTNDFNGYNRINEISSKLIREARGYN